MKKILFITFDLIRKGESNKSLAMSSILSYLKQDYRYGENFFIYHLPINMFNLSKETRANDLIQYLNIFNFYNFDFIAVSAYIWNEFLINDLMLLLRNKFDFKGKFILGGYQITYSSNPKFEYPEADYFISGYAEESVLKILTENINNNFLNFSVDFSKIPSPYLTKELEISNFQKMVRMETKRGCPYRCTFCAHRDLLFNKVYKHQLEKIFTEIAFFKEKKVNKINIIDPIFNSGKQYLDVLDEFIRTNTTSLISIQTRFETITGSQGEKFINYCERLNINLEFGLQTANEEESKLINRKNNLNKIKTVMKKLNDRKISYEISLIYGLPNQTLESFKNSISFVVENGCTNITAYPLMLLKGTELSDKKKLYGFKEKKIGEFNIPVVTQSNTFTENDWYKMKKLADSLSPNNRI